MTPFFTKVERNVRDCEKFLQMQTNEVLGIPGDGFPQAVRF